MAFFAEMRGDNPFKVKALKNGADIFSEEPKSLAELVASGELTKMPGVGKGTQAMVKEFLASGKVAEFEEMKNAFPAGMLELRELPGLGPKKIKTLHDELGISSVSELEYACQENRLTELKGFGAKTQQNILQNIAKLKSNRGKVILPVALQDAEEVVELIEKVSGVESVHETGDLRRRAEVIASLDFVVEGEPTKMAAGFRKAGWQSEGEEWVTASDRGLKVRVWPVDAEHLGSQLFLTTGPAAYVEKMGKVAPAAEEKEVFAKHKVDFLPAECRDLGHAPKKLVEVSDIKGVFHMHTRWSDGKNTLAEMAEAAVELGYEYIGVSEHSQTAFYANGLNEKRVEEQRREIDKLQEKFPQLRIFQGIESDILTDGALDFPDSFLKKFDFVIGSVHGQMKMNREDMTKRICRALAHPATTWLGHWSGRLLLGREGFAFDPEEVLACAARHGKSIELNSNPYRLDVDWRFLPRLTELKIPVGIFPDAHSTGGLADIKYGVMMARKGGLTPAQVVNTKSRKEMEAWLAERKFR